MHIWAAIPQWVTTIGIYQRHNYNPQHEVCEANAADIPFVGLGYCYNIIDTHNSHSISRTNGLKCEFKFDILPIFCSIMVHWKNRVILGLLLVCFFQYLSSHGGCRQFASHFTAKIRSHSRNLACKVQSNAFIKSCADPMKSEGQFHYHTWRLFVKFRITIREHDFQALYPRR